MLKKYRYQGLVFQFEEGKAPQGAEEIAPKKEPQEPKAAPKRNKAARKSNK